MPTTAGWSTPANLPACIARRGSVIGGTQIAVSGGPAFTILQYAGNQVPGECIRDRDEPGRSNMTWGTTGPCDKLPGLSDSVTNTNWDNASLQGSAQIGYLANPTDTSLTFQPYPGFVSANQCLAANWSGGLASLGHQEGPPPPSPTPAPPATMPGDGADIVWVGDTGAFFA